MRSAKALPFNTLSDKEVSAGEWCQVDNENISTQTESAETGILGWGYDTKLRLGRAFKIDVDHCLKLLGLISSNVNLRLLVLVETGQPGIRNVVFSRLLPREEEFREIIGFNLHSANMCEEIRLNTVIVLDGAHDIHKTFVPRVPGARLWEDRITIPLEGSGSRFPLRSCSFKDLVRVPDHAQWFLDWSPDLADHAFAGSVVLYINTDDEKYSSLIADGDKATLAVLQTEMIAEICVGMLANKVFVEDEETYDEGSLGGITNSWLMYAFPGKKKKEISQFMMQRTSEFFVKLRVAFQ